MEIAAKRNAQLEPAKKKICLDRYHQYYKNEKQNLHTCDVEKYKAMIENVKQQVLAKEKKSLPKHGK